MSKFSINNLSTRPYNLSHEIKITESLITPPQSTLQPVYPNLLISPTEAVITYTETGVFYIKNGNEVLYEFTDNPSSFNDYLHSFVTALLLFQRRHLLLHGNSCIWNNKHIAFCGDSNSGKSSLAAQFHKRGALHFCDEILCCEEVSQKFIPGFPFLRLWKNDLEFNQFNSNLVSALWDNEEKYKLKTIDQRAFKKRKLDFIISLKIDHSLSRPKIQELLGIKKLQAFWEAYYHPQVISAMNLERDFNHLSLKIIPQIKVFQLSHPGQVDTRSECFNLIKNNIN